METGDPFSSVEGVGIILELTIAIGLSFYKL